MKVTIEPLHWADCRGAYWAPRGIDFQCAELGEREILGAWRSYDLVGVVQVIFTGAWLVTEDLDLKDGTKALLYHFHVIEALRRKKIGAQLLQAAEQVAREKGFAELALQVAINNHEAARFYRRYGYRLFNATSLGPKAEQAHAYIKNLGV